MRDKERIRCALDDAINGLIYVRDLTLRSGDLEAVADDCDSIAADLNSLEMEIRHG